RVLDYGCSSGVLAIAALKLGASQALAIDIDPQAWTATQDNARRNGVENRLRIGAVELAEGITADLVLANILAEPLEQLAPRIAARVEAGGEIVLSGILVAQADKVAAAYAPWFDVTPAVFRDGWARLHGVRRAEYRC